MPASQDPLMCSHRRARHRKPGFKRPEPRRSTNRACRKRSDSTGGLEGRDRQACYHRRKDGISRHPGHEHGGHRKWRARMGTCLRAARTRDRRTRHSRHAVPGGVGQQAGHCRGRGFARAARKVGPRWRRAPMVEGMDTCRSDHAAAVAQSHGGLTISGFSGYTPGAALPAVTQILNGQPPANNGPVRVATRPGTKVEYSGGGYVVVQQLVMDVTRLPFDEWMRNTVFTPLNMSHSHFEQPLSDELARSAAFGHRRDGAKLEGGWMIHPELAPAGLWTTPTDLARLIIEVQDAAAGRPSRALEPQRAREILTGRVDNAGLGFFLTGPNGSSRRFMHRSEEHTSELQSPYV